MNGSKVMFRASNEPRESISERTWLLSARQFLVSVEPGVSGEHHTEDNGEAALETEIRSAGDA